jgi:hypothetical protein
MLLFVLPVIAFIIVMWLLLIDPPMNERKARDREWHRRRHR